MDKTKDELTRYLEVIRNNYDVLKLTNQKQQNEEIKRYYLSNHLAYFLFHNREGFMHMGISKGNTYKKSDLLEPLNIINANIRKVKAKKVLELGAGKGANSTYLAEMNKKSSFVGIDLSKLPLRKNKVIPNYVPKIGDYHDLSAFEDDSFDIVFTIEALCHSNNKQKVLKQVYKKLRKGGLFIVFDGYYRMPNTKMSQEESLASLLTEKAMAVDAFENVRDFEMIIRKTNFKRVKSVDYSQNILPTLKRFKKQALIFYYNKLLTRLIQSVFPEDLTKNSIAGLLMPTLIERGISCYYLHVLEK